MVMSFPGLLTLSLSTRELESWDSGGRPGAHLCKHYPASSLRTETSSTSASSMHTVGAQRKSGSEWSCIIYEALQGPSPQLDILCCVVSASSDLVTSSCSKCMPLTLFRGTHPTSPSCLYPSGSLTAVLQSNHCFNLILQLSFKSMESAEVALVEPLFWYSNILYAFSHTFIIPSPIKMVMDGRLAA